jgi:hypothetical protein
MTLFKTDQTDCYDADGQLIDCRASGQDGDVRAGMSWPEHRFEIGARTALDRLTGLMWPNAGDLSDFPLTWQEAHDFVRDMNRKSVFGYRDWLLPSRSQLFSLVSHARINPALPSEAPFENVFPGYYWTSSPCSGFENQAWYVHLGGARVFRGMRHGSYMMWPVRYQGHNGIVDISPDAENPATRAPDPSSGRKPPVHRWETDGDAVLDRLNGLTWLKDTGPLRAPVTWPEALERVAALNADRPLGKDDWRLPNIRELESLIDIGRHSPAMAIGRSGFVPEGCWSSTTSIYEPRYAWVVYFGDGAVGVGYKSRPTFHTWAVRGGEGLKKSRRTSK